MQEVGGVEVGQETQNHKGWTDQKSFYEQGETSLTLIEEKNGDTLRSLECISEKGNIYIRVTRLLQY